MSRRSLTALEEALVMPALPWARRLGRRPSWSIERTLERAVSRKVERLTLGKYSFRIQRYRAGGWSLQGLHPFNCSSAGSGRACCEEIESLHIVIASYGALEG